MDQKSNNRLVKNVSWIFFSNVFHAILNFILGIYVARKLSLDDNGLINYAASWITFFSALSSLGIWATISKDFATYRNRDGEFLCSGIGARLIFGVISVGMLQIVVRVLNPGEPYLHLIVLCQSTSILFSSFDLFIYWFRYYNQANIVAIARIIAFGISALWRIIVLFLGADLIWYVVGTAAETILFGLMLVCCFATSYKGKFFFSFRTVKQMCMNSYPFVFSAILSTIYSQADKIMLKSMLNASAVALYSVSAYLATAIGMIPSALIEGFRADIMEYKGKDETLYKKRMRQLYGIVFWASISYCVFIAIFSKQILLMLYGDKYVSASKTLALIVWYSTFSYFGAINNLYMVAEGKAKWVQITTLSGAVGNVVLNYLLIPIWGIDGAALASLLTQFIANFVVLAVIKDLRPALKLMLNGVTFRDTGFAEFFRYKYLAKVKRNRE